MSARVVPMSPAELRGELEAVQADVATNARAMRERMQQIESQYYAAVESLLGRMVDR